ncbi:hypothetical protein A3D42_01110 [Candidatus Nomurabacteria bacterium RIFCSPHIGHO2_02_FULL_41_18]|uniref:Putative gluconeogenesis factor n=1 Tax=Candidatus Nomurabacteria bacterium RIFCSPHIGHO2_02_FULL_41_18 TaxID=1801754 RepID=A0A1F6W6M7_9BACT|nr:MAG: hypothetical protein A2737_03315 [Candidatus Nomurabacteria bacterium RIFCSPHIGHO2_01_FULL_41_71]OGI77578.1 MAG: hypothetical protein A3D42_01110 [Candidatus Nomurabacteria bacterium RIFCSPHIGHO2_02_FULL_41_18]OGI89078.1 MAG: hypothetical protein A3B01_00690 [Candidatus Nomurabacteria bacterium RIFCSPLOWO2_01_FULL_41_52b]
MKNIVTIGGGTGSYTVLSGLKNIPNISISAIVSMADDGGSTGVLRDELGVLPPGDVRQCLVALSEHSDKVRKLMNYRFQNGALSGHSFGNIFLAALEKVTGDFALGVEIASEILKIKGKVVPITKDKADLLVELSNGKIINGENAIQNTNVQRNGIKKIFYKNKISLSEHAKVAILNADAIILGPGNYYCSIVPNLIIGGFKEAINKSRAKIIFPVNLTNKLGHTAGWRVSDYVRDIEERIGKKIDIILVNNKKPNPAQIKAYESEEGKGALVLDDLEEKRVVRAPLLSLRVVIRNKKETFQVSRGYIRHDPAKLTNSIKTIIEKN